MLNPPHYSTALPLDLPDSDPEFMFDPQEAEAMDYLLNVRAEAIQIDQILQLKQQYDKEV